jgi:hypothetical protein
MPCCTRPLLALPCLPTYNPMQGSCCLPLPTLSHACIYAPPLSSELVVETQTSSIPCPHLCTAVAATHCALPSLLPAQAKHRAGKGQQAVVRTFSMHQMTLTASLTPCPTSQCSQTLPRLVVPLVLLPVAAA